MRQANFLEKNSLETRSSDARRFVSLKFCCHSRSLSIIRLYTFEYVVSVSILICLFLVPFLRYSTWNNGLPLDRGLVVVQGHWKCIENGTIRHDFLLACHSKNSSILYHIRVIWRWRIKVNYFFINPEKLTELPCGGRTGKDVVPRLSTVQP